MYIQLGTFRTKWTITQRNIKLAAVTVQEATAPKWCITSSAVLRHVLTNQDRRYNNRLKFINKLKWRELNGGEIVEFLLHI